LEKVTVDDDDEKDYLYNDKKIQLMIYKPVVGVRFVNWKKSY